MSNNKTPSLVAMLGLLAVAGYQNRDKSGEMIRANRGASDPSTDPHHAQKSGLLDEIGSIFGVDVGCGFRVGGPVSQCWPSFGCRQLGRIGCQSGGGA